ncbi:DUF4266 domain-containing protein [Shewanella ulleungensis]|jgi:hypothetical protein|uniref:DUF4266 domain-containing protein n=1 Tax=Shewanella ulleungensis TaxID=2282699 RepID=A0ABQ2QYE7_9GAMM|nr:DUF4266 domain-containing protein [Shewanella ulleungensis]MCL1152148.1 DUF4266 domain-containing protein [Shewanella ulleungensis]GGP99469.1 hypothetical protein GCM10009410_36570 [Shewanella ulleungensis]
MKTFTLSPRTIALTLKGIALLSIIGLSGCSSMGIEPWVKPYERQNLADPIMRMNRHPSASMHIAHVLEGRESSRGAEGTGGGGCGCN